MKTSGKLTSHLWPKKTALTHLKRDSHSCNVWFLITGHRSVFQPFFTWPGPARRASWLMKSLKRDQDLLHPLNVMMRSHDLAWAVFWGPAGLEKRVMFSQLSVELYLVGGVPTPLKNDGVRQLGRLFPIYGKIKNVPIHQPVYVCWR